MDSEFIWLIIGVTVISVTTIICGNSIRKEEQKTAQMELQLKIEMVKSHVSTNNSVGF